MTSNWSTPAVGREIVPGCRLAAGFSSLGGCARPDAFAFGLIERTLFQLAEAFPPLHNGFNGNEIDQVVPALSQNGGTDSDEARKPARGPAKAGGMNGELQAAVEAPERLVGVEAGLPPFGGGRSKDSTAEGRL